MDNQIDAEPFKFVTAFHKSSDEQYNKSNIREKQMVKSVADKKYKGNLSWGEMKVTPNKSKFLPYFEVNFIHYIHFYLTLSSYLFCPYQIILRNFACNIFYPQSLL